MAILYINYKSAQKEEGGGGGCVPSTLHETLLKTPKSEGLANTLPNACKERSNPIKSKKENIIINNSKTFATAVLTPPLVFCYWR